MSFLPNSLRSRFLVIVGLALIVVGVVGHRVVVWYADEVTHALSTRFAERYALYEKARMVNVLVREMTLAQKMASSPILKRWLAAEGGDDGERLFAELEDYRSFFRSRSWFVAAAAASGNYYYDDGSGGAATPRYTLDRTILKDGWFYALMAGGETQQLNVDTDRGVGVTNVWINTVVRDESGTALAATGTGINLTDFIRNVVSSGQDGVTNTFLDRGGAIQAHPDVSMIDFASTRKAVSNEERSTVFALLDSPADADALRAAMAALAEGKGEVGTLEVGVGGRRRFIGVAWVPEIKWFVATFVDPRLVARDPVTPAVVPVLVAGFVLVLLVVALLNDATVLRRLARLDCATRRIGEGDYRLAPDPAPDEIGSLSRALAEMAGRIAAHTEDLERQVAERTAELEQAAYTDFLTGMLNRRSMLDRMEASRARQARSGGKLAILLIDADHFKRINDTRGHAVGDRALAHLAGILRRQVRAYDLCARWGGEEFLIAMENVHDVDELRRVAEHLCTLIRETPLEDETGPVLLTVSIGVTLGNPEEDLDAMISRADAALYQAKARGRDRVVAACPAERG